MTAGRWATDRRRALGRAAAPLLLVALLGGCASLSEGECRTADWYEIGRRDGEDGLARARLHEHDEACGEYGIDPHRAAYFEGREAGLQDYCTAANGYREGRAGHPYREVCPRRAERRFLPAYRHGQAIHELEDKLDAIDNAIERKEGMLDDDDTDAEQRADIRDSLRTLDREYRRYSRELIDLERRFGGPPYGY